VRLEVAINRTHSRYAMPWYHMLCRHAESQGARSRPATESGDGKVKTHQTQQRVEWAGQHQAHQGAGRHGDFTRSRAAEHHPDPGPVGRQAGIATRVQCSSRNRRLSPRVSVVCEAAGGVGKGIYSHMA
jgi:hypothetical protein